MDGLELAPRLGIMPGRAIPPSQLELADLDRFTAAMQLRRRGAHQRPQAGQLLRDSLDMYRCLRMPTLAQIRRAFLPPQHLDRSLDDFSVILADWL